MMPPLESTLKRIAEMSDDDLQNYGETLGDQVRRKRDKMNRLRGDLDRQTNLLEVVHQELARRARSHGYRSKR